MKPSTKICNDSLHNKPVVSLEDGKQIGHVDDFLIDFQHLKLGAIVIKSEDGLSVLPFDKVRSIGDDAITVDSIKSTQSGPSSLPGVRSFSVFQGQSVVDSAGTLLGKLSDVEFEEASGTLETLHVRSGGFLGMGSHDLEVAASDVCSFGPDLITVKEAKSTETAVPT